MERLGHMQSRANSADLTPPGGRAPGRLPLLPGRSGLLLLSQSRHRRLRWARGPSSRASAWLGAVGRGSCPAPPPALPLPPCVRVRVRVRTPVAASLAGRPDLAWPLWAPFPTGAHQPLRALNSVVQRTSGCPDRHGRAVAFLAQQLAAR